MSKSRETSNKKDKEKLKSLKKKDKEHKKQERKANSKKGGSWEEMLAYVDEFGNITTTPPHLQNRTVINEEDIVIGVSRRAAEEPESLVRTGIVTFFNESKGFGFIKDQANGESIFVHINSVNFQIKENNKVSFEVEKGMKGPVAVKVALVK
jgi:cold shock CspA family protein